MVEYLTKEASPKLLIPARNCLFNALAAALDQNHQHNYRKDTSHYANHRYIVHVSSPFLMN
jgi:7-cyano-7-deazaguanine synthase in queuosine biosynthesis